eukprot:4864326-Amphidinium_carterae.1
MASTQVPVRDQWGRRRHPQSECPRDISRLLACIFCRVSYLFHAFHTTAYCTNARVGLRQKEVLLSLLT